jgi:hypothetical protein
MSKKHPCQGKLGIKKCPSGRALLRGVEEAVKVGVRGKRLNAGWNEQYLLKLLLA